jgi:hypothetical protein
MDDLNKEHRRKNIEQNKSFTGKKPNKYHDEDQMFMKQAKKAFKQKKQSLIEEELWDEMDDYK